MKSLQVATALLLVVAAAGTVGWYALWRGRVRLARITGRTVSRRPPTGLFVVFSLAVALAATPLVIALVDPAESIDRIGAAVLLVVIAVAWATVARRSLRRDP